MWRRFLTACQPLGALVLACAVAALVIQVTGGSPAESFSALARGIFGNVAGMAGVLVQKHELHLTNETYRTLGKATPLLFSGLAVAIALKAGLFNIGVEGQLLVGGLASAWVGYAVTGLPAAAHLPLALAAGIAAGAAWAAVPGLLKAWRGTHEVIVTIMMNYIAIYTCHYLVTHPLIEPAATNPNNAPRTPAILATAQLWSIPGVPAFSAGFGIALLVAVAVSVLMKRTALGFEIRAVGLGPQAARAAGLPVGRTLVVAMLISGGLAGLAGGVEVLGNHHRYFDAFSPGYGFDSIAVALLGNLAPLGVTLSSLVFGGLDSGAITMEAYTDTPRQIAGIVQAIVILAVGARAFRRRVQ